MGYMVKSFTASVLLLLAISLHAQETIYHWSSNEGVVMETGGTVVQHNATMPSRINNECSGFYVITLLGKGEDINLEDDSQSAQYMEITLADGISFREADIITISGMRNTTNLNANATIFMQFDNGIKIPDNNIWNNLGQLFEVIVEGGTSTGAMRIGDGNEDFSEVSAFPSTYTFVVPAEAEGCTSLRLSRDVCQCRLYLTEIHISRMNEDISGIAGTTLYTCSPVFDLQGRKATNAMRGIIISNGRKYVNKNNKIGN